MDMKYDEHGDKDKRIRHMINMAGKRRATK